MRRIAAVAWILALATSAAAADPPFDPGAVARAAAPYLDDRTLAVGHLDLSRLDADALLTAFARLAGMDDQASRPGREAVKKSLDAFRAAGGKDAYLVFSIADLFEAPFFIFPVREGGDVQALVQVVRDMGLSPSRADTRQLGNAVFAGRPATLERLIKRKPTPRPELLEALKGAGETSVGQLAFLPSQDDCRSLEETLPNLPPEIGGGSIKAFTQGLQWAVLGVETSPAITLRLTVRSPDARAAKELHDAVAKVFQAAGSRKDVHEAVPGFDKLVRLFTPKVEGDRLTLVLEDKALAPLLQPVLTSALASAARMQSSNNLKQIGLAMHNFHDTYGRFPAAAIYDKARKTPLLSWRVHLLPFLEQDNLYRQFKLDEPWDSEHNKQLIARMPKVYQSSNNPQLIAAGKTTYLAPVGQTKNGIGLMFVPGRPDGVRIVEVNDGTSNTIFLVDAEDDKAVVWTKPDDLEVTEDNPAKGLAVRNSGYLTLFVDGSVRVLSKDIDRKTLWALFTRNGGEVIDDLP
jgi:hypothetical protein